MRLLLYQLRPLLLEQEGLGQALKMRLKTVEERMGIAVTYYSEAALELPVDIEIELYYLAIEALNNALKHADATGLTVKLKTIGDRFHLEIIDDGGGFDPTQGNYSLPPSKNQVEPCVRPGNSVLPYQLGGGSERLLPRDRVGP